MLQKVVRLDFVVYTEGPREIALQRRDEIVAHLEGLGLSLTYIDDGTTIVMHEKKQRP